MGVNYSILSTSYLSLLTFVGKCQQKVQIISVEPVGDQHFEMKFKCLYSTHDLKSILHYCGTLDYQLMKNELTVID